MHHFACHHYIVLLLLYFICSAFNVIFSTQTDAMKWFSDYFHIICPVFGFHLWVRYGGVDSSNMTLSSLIILCIRFSMFNELGTSHKWICHVKHCSLSLSADSMQKFRVTLLKQWTSQDFNTSSGRSLLSGKVDVKIYCSTQFMSCAYLLKPLLVLKWYSQNTSYGIVSSLFNM